MKRKILIFIPAYNCEKQLPRVIEKIDERIQHWVTEVLIVDNRSQDQTVEAAQQSATGLDLKVTILRNRENYSLGGSIKRAFLYAIENQYDYMITLHGDDQADIRDFAPLLESGREADYDLVIGSRFHPDSVLKGYSMVRIVGNRVLNVVCGVLNGRRVDDLIAGLNCFSIPFFKDKFFLPFPNNLTFDAHVLLYAFSKKARIAHVPITWREEDQVSNAKAVRQALILLRLFFSHFWLGEKVFAVNKSGRPLDFDYPSEIVFQKEATGG